jgi:acyl carrier protein
MNDLDASIKKILEGYGLLGTPPASLGPDDDLYQRGMSSHASVNVMLALEDEFDVEFPDALLKRDTFRTVATIREALKSMGVPA